MKTKKFIAMAAAMTLIANAGVSLISPITVNADTRGVETVPLNYPICTEKDYIECYYTGNERATILEQATVLNTGEVIVDFISMNDIIKPDDIAEPCIFETGLKYVIYDTREYSLAVENDALGFIADWSPYTQKKDGLVSPQMIWNGSPDEPTYDSRIEHKLPDKVRADIMPDIIHEGDTLFTLHFTPCCDLTVLENEPNITADKVLVHVPIMDLNPNELVTTINPYNFTFTMPFGDGIDYTRYMLYPNGDIIITISNDHFYDITDESYLEDKERYLEVPEGYTASCSFSDKVKDTSTEAIDKGLYKINYTFDVFHDIGTLCWFTLHRNAPVTEDIILKGDSADCVVEHMLINRFAPTGIWGDANCDEQVNMADVVLIMQSITNPDKYGLDHDGGITRQGLLNADVYENGTGITNSDALSIQKFLLDLIDKLPEE